MKIVPIITNNIAKNARKLATAAMFTAATLGMTSSLVSCNNNKQDNTQTELISKEASQAQQAYTGINIKDLQHQTNIQTSRPTEINTKLYEKYNKTGHLNDATYLSISRSKELGTYASAMHMTAEYNSNMYEELLSSSGNITYYYNQENDPANMPKSEFKKKLRSLKNYNKEFSKTLKKELEALINSNATFEMYNTYLDSKFAEVFINYDLEDDYAKRIELYEPDQNESKAIENSNLLAYKLDILYTYKMNGKFKELGLDSAYPNAIFDFLEPTHFYKYNYSLSEKGRIDVPKIFANPSTPPKFTPDIKPFIEAKEFAKVLGFGVSANGYFMPSITQEVTETLAKQKGSFAAAIDLVALYNYFVFDKVIFKTMEREFNNALKNGEKVFLTKEQFELGMEKLRTTNEKTYQWCTEETHKLSKERATYDDYNQMLTSALSNINEEYDIPDEIFEDQGYLIPIWSLYPTPCRLSFDSKIKGLQVTTSVMYAFEILNMLDWIFPVPPTDNMPEKIWEYLITLNSKYYPPVDPDKTYKNKSTEHITELIKRSEPYVPSALTR